MKPILATSAFCGPCKMLQKRLTEIGAVYETRDMAEDREFFQKHQIRSVPVLITSETEKVMGTSEILEFFQKNP